MKKEKQVFLIDDIYFAIDDKSLKAIPVIANTNRTAIKRLDNNQILRRLNNYFNPDEQQLISRILEIDGLNVYRIVTLPYALHNSVLLESYLTYLRSLIGTDKYESKTISLSRVLRIKNIIEKELIRSSNEQKRDEIRKQRKEESLIKRLNKKEQLKLEKENKIAEIHNQTTNF